MTSLFSLDSDGVIRLARWRDYSWLEHGFGTRHAKGWTGMVATAKQVHGTDVLVAEGADGCLGIGDALVTDVPGQIVAIRTADCVPALLVDPEHRATAAVHAGWRGTVAGVIPAALRRMREMYRTRPEAVEIALGPCISACCFEVGPEVAREFACLFPERSGLNEKTRIDLIEANRRLALQAGVRPESVYAVEECTMCGSTRYHSHRRDAAKAGRMAAAAGIRMNEQEKTRRCSEQRLADSSEAERRKAN